MTDPKEILEISAPKLFERTTEGEETFWKGAGANIALTTSTDDNLISVENQLLQDVVAATPGFKSAEFKQQGMHRWLVEQGADNTSSHQRAFVHFGDVLVKIEVYGPPDKPERVAQLMDIAISSARLRNITDEAMAWRAFEKGLFRQALPGLEALPESDKVQAALYDCYYNLRDWDRVLKMHQERTKKEPDAPEALRLLAGIKCEMGQGEEALEVYNKYAQGGNEDQWLRASILSAVGHKNEARAIWRKLANSKEPQSQARAKNSLAWDMVEAGEFESAIPLASEAIELRSNHHILHTRGVAYLGAGKVEEAMADLDAAFGEAPNSFFVNYDIARTFQAQGEFDSARFFYHRYLQLAGDKAEHYEQAQTFLAEIKGK